ncbi:hypothetical protein BDW62DRAFT_185974 [Aspergillus aurantiobrunneus]
MGSDSLQLPSDPAERRRLQNRIAQRGFRQKKQLERSLDRTPNDRTDEPAAHAENNAALDFAIPDALHLGITTTSSHSVEDVALDLETIDSLLDSYNPSDPPLDAQLFSSFFSARPTQA